MRARVVEKTSNDTRSHFVDLIKRVRRVTDGVGSDTAADWAFWDFNNSPTVNTPTAGVLTRAFGAFEDQRIADGKIPNFARVVGRDDAAAGDDVAIAAADHHARPAPYVSAAARRAARETSCAQKRTRCRRGRAEHPMASRRQRLELREHRAAIARCRAMTAIGGVQGAGHVGPDAPAGQIDVLSGRAFGQRRRFRRRRRPSRRLADQRGSSASLYPS